MLTRLALRFRFEGFVLVRARERLREGVSEFAPFPVPMKSLNSSVPFGVRLCEVVKFESIRGGKNTV
jgi:hypothetical protein